MDMYDLIKKTIKRTYRVIKDIKLDTYAKKYIQRVKKQKKKSDKIKVLFIVQMPELWDKQQKVFEIMKENNAFEPRLLIVPKYDLKNNSLGEYGDELMFFLSFDENAIRINEIDEYNSFISLYDYIFYQRQYNNYLPEFLRGDNVVKYSKICYIPYATPEIKKTGLYNKDFYRYVYLGFLESENACHILRKKFKKNYRKGIQKFIFEGYPVFESMLNQNSECFYNKILWTPRWSYDPFAGGSHFFEYCDNIIDYAKKNPHVNVCIRPHPMMFDNFIKEKRMTQDDVDSYIKEVTSSNATIDSNIDITSTFQNTDILISDKSSVITMFFLTGKPIIYCPIDCDHGYLFQTIMPGLYIANSWDDIEKVLGSLTVGKDELKDIRKNIIDESFRNNKSASERIVNAIYNDYYEDSI